VEEKLEGMERLKKHKELTLKTEGTYHYGKLDMKGRVVLKCVRNRQCQIKPPTHVAHHWHCWWTQVNTNMNIQVP
jgi:hypothetical protein